MPDPAGGKGSHEQADSDASEDGSDHDYEDHLASYTSISTMRWIASDPQITAIAAMSTTIWPSVAA